MARVRDVESFYNFIGYVVLRAPNAFPREDYLQDHEQMTLDKKFEELRAADDPSWGAGGAWSCATTVGWLRKPDRSVKETKSVLRPLPDRR